MRDKSYFFLRLLINRVSKKPTSFLFSSDSSYATFDRNSKSKAISKAASNSAKEPSAVFRK